MKIDWKYQNNRAPLLIVSVLLFVIIVSVVYASPSIVWEDPTPADDSTQSENAVYLNTTITDSGDINAFFDWNDDLVGYWNFEYTNATGVFDNSSNNYFASYRSSWTPNITTGKFGNALNLDQTDGNGVIISDSDAPELSGMSEITVGVWINFTAWGGRAYRYVVGKGNWASQREWRIRQEPDKDLIAWEISTNGAATTEVNIDEADVPVNEWHYIVGTWTNTTGTLNVYLDGVLKDSGIKTGASLHDGSGNFAIGSSGDNGGGADDDLNGVVDEVRVWNRILTEEEINASYDAGLYRLYHNFTDLEDGTYDYSAFVINGDGELIESERTVTIGEVTDSCTYSSGDWEIDCSDNCVISTDTDLGGNNLMISGSGTLVFNATISGVDEIIRNGEDCPTGLWGSHSIISS